MAGKSSAQGGTDRRVARTRSTLRKALVELIPDKPFDQITVEAICAAANIGRSTFYAHYKSKNDLRRETIDDRLTSLLAHRRETNGEASPTLIILEHVRDYWRLHRRQGPHDLNMAAEPIRRAATNLLKTELGSIDGEPSFRRDFRLHYLVGGFMSVLVWWLERGAHEPPEQIDALFQQISNSGALGSRGGQ